MSRRGRAQSLAARLADNGAALLTAYRTNSEAADKGQPITPAAEWLIDNYHLVERQFREVRSDLPPGYYRQLPKLAEGPFIGYPRIFGIAWAFVAHTDSRFDAELLRRFLLAYQEVQPLTIGELWALSITLRIVLIENLRRLADLIVRSRDDRERANAVADRILGVQRATASNRSEIVLAGLSTDDVSNAFAVQIVQRLHDQDARIIPALAWLERAARRARQHGRQGGQRGTSASGRRHRHHQQHHQQPAGDHQRRLVGRVREHQPRRPGARRRPRLPDDGFCHPQSLPQRRRGTGARQCAFGDRSGAALAVGGRCRIGRGGRRTSQPTPRTRLSSDRRRPAGVRAVTRISAGSPGVRSRRGCRRLGIGGYVGARRCGDGGILLAALA